MQCTWEKGKGWKHRFLLASNRIWPIKETKSPSKRSRKNEWNDSVQKIYCLSFFSLLLIMPCLVRSHHLSFQWGRYSCSVASLKLRIFLLYFPKWMYQLNQLVNWKLLCVSQPQLSVLSTEWCTLLTSSTKQAISQLWAAEWLSWCTFPAACFPKELLLHIPLVTQQALGTLYPHSFCVKKKYCSDYF